MAILNFGESQDRLGSPDPAERDTAAEPARRCGLWSPRRSLPAGGAACAVFLDEQTLASDGEYRETRGLRMRFSVFPGHVGVCSILESAHERPGRDLN